MTLPSRLTLSALALILSHQPVFAEQASPTINIAISPELSAQGKAYDDFIKTLTPEQKAKLESLDKLATEAEMPMTAIQLKEKILRACIAKNPSYKDTHPPMLQHYRVEKIGETKILRDKVSAAINEINFVPPDLINGHLNLKMQMGTQLTKGMGDLALRIGSLDKLCPQEMGELEKMYTTPYPRLSTASFDKPELMEIESDEYGKMKKCRVSLGTLTDNHYYLSIAILYSSYEGKHHLEFSGKIFNPEKVAIPIKMIWLNFGEIDTRLAARQRIPKPDLFMGSLPSALIEVILAKLRDEDTVISIQSLDGEINSTFIPAKTSIDGSNQMASCVAGINPALSDSLKKSGFFIDQTTVGRRNLNEQSP